MYEFKHLSELPGLINEDAPVFFDTETCGLYGKVRLAQFYQEHWKYVVFIDWPDALELALFLTSCKAKLVMQNASYDISTVQRNTVMRIIPPLFSDTLLLARLALPRLEGYSLDNLMYHLLDFDPYAKHGIMDKKEMQKTNWSAKVLTDKQLAYAAVDVLYLPEVFNRVQAFEQDFNYQLDILSLRHALDFQNNGLPVLVDEVETQYRSNLREIDILNMPINVNSYVQVRKYLDCDKSDGLTLATMALQGDERAAKVIKTKKLLKQNSFLDKFLTDDQRIYGIFAPLARSGRFTCKEQNLQQTPRDVKHVFGVTPDSGRVMLYADYPQLELRTIAAIVHERKLVEIFKTGGDPHGIVAASIFGENYTATDRQITKTYNFNLLYGGGAGMIQGILIKQANTLRDIDLIKREVRAWKRAWPAIAAWQEEVIRSHRRGDLRQTPLGRKYMGKLITDHANIENQGFGADVAKLALHYMMPDLKAENAQLCNFVHDSFMVEMDEDMEANKRVAKRMQEAMKDAWSEACKAVTVKDIPMPAQVFCGRDLGTIEKTPIFEVK